MGKIRLNITIDEKLVEDLKAVVPDYISLSGFIEAFFKEYLEGYHKFDWSLDEMLEVLKGETSVSHLKRVHKIELEDGSCEFVEESKEEEEKSRQQIAKAHALEKKHRETNRPEEVFLKSKTKVIKGLKKKGAKHG